MNNFIESITGFFSGAKPIPSGVYHYQTPPDADQQYRLHLRINDQGEGLLIVNAATVLHLNQTATEHVYHYLQETPADEVARIISRRYQIQPHDARLDYLDIQHRITSLITIPDLDPVSFFEFTRETPYSGAENAPYRLDCAITYQLPDNSNPELAPQRRVDRELETQEWITILDKAWEAGIPHLVFTGGEPTTRPDLIDLITHAEKNGQVTGLLTDGLKLDESEYLNQLLLSGLDHLMFALNPNQKASWQALKAVLKADLFTTVHLTIKPNILPQLSQIIDHLAEMNANAISLAVSDPSDPKLNRALSQAQTQIAELGLPLKWDLPVPYSNHNPVALELENETEQPEGAGKAWLYVEPDGDVLPSQGINQVLGNILRDDWKKIWQNAKLHTD